MSTSFFFEKLSFDAGMLNVYLQQSNHPWALVKFNLPRAFRFFNESDNFSYLQNYDGQDLLNGYRGCCISESKTASYLIEYLSNTPESRLEDNLRSIVIVTPQECVEVISFESPYVEMLG